MPYSPKPEVYLKNHLAPFTQDELARAYALVIPISEARAQAASEYANPEGAFVGDTFAMLAAVSEDTARRVADLLEEPIGVVYQIRDEILARLAQTNRGNDSG